MRVQKIAGVGKFNEQIGVISCCSIIEGPSNSKNDLFD